MKQFVRVTLLALLLSVLAPAVRAQALVYCIAGTNTPCISASQVGNGSQGDPLWKDFGKINENFTNPSWLSTYLGTTGVSQLVLPSISTPGLPASGGVLNVDSNGALHFQSQWYDSVLIGGKYIGDATRPWFTAPLGFGVTVTGSGNNRPNLRIQKANSSSLSGIELSLLDTLGANITAQETSVVFQTICPTGNPSYDGVACVVLQVEADKNAGGDGNPFAANFVAKDLTGAQFALVGTETDVIASNPDPTSNHVRVISDNICREIVAQTLGLTTCGDGIRARPSDNKGATTGPVELVNAFDGWTEGSYPGAFIGDVFESDGGALNGVHLFSKSVTAPTAAQGTSGTPTLTFNIASLPAASPGAWISDGGEGFIPAGTTISSVSTTAGVTTITMSANQTGNVANGQTITITQAFNTGELLNGNFNIAARSVTTQYGLEETLQNGLVLGAATGGAKGVGTLNAVHVYSSDTIIPSTTKGIVGTALADAAQAGSVGELQTVSCGGDSTATITVTIAAPAVVTWASHPFSASSPNPVNWECPINFTNSGGALPTGLAPGTTYYIDGATLSGDTFEISDTAAHALAGTNHVTTTGSQSGTQTGWMGAFGSNLTVYGAAGMKLTPGDWDCTDVSVFSGVTSVTATAFFTGVNTSAGSLPAQGNYTQMRIPSGVIGTADEMPPGVTVQENISSTTTVYANTESAFSGGTQNESAFLRCRRIR
jgi:hypothetical protein